MKVRNLITVLNNYIDSSNALGLGMGLLAIARKLCINNITGLHMKYITGLVPYSLLSGLKHPSQQSLFDGLGVCNRGILTRFLNALI